MIRPKYRIGIDIGGTNTDIVLVNSEAAIIAYAKTPTTSDTHSGVKTALMRIIKEVNGKKDIGGIFLGTTQAANAIHQQEDLYRVGVIRIAGHYPQSMPSCYMWPESLKKMLYVDTVNVDGGFECHGDPITPMNPTQIRSAINDLLKKKIESLAVVGVFASLNPKQELLVKEIGLDVSKGNLPISLSHQIGGTGFFERENSTILNAALKKVMTNVFKNIVNICTELELVCPIWITQNNGSILDIKHAIEYPVLTVSAGPTNSFIGGMRLAGLEDVIVVDIGGTSTDVGIIQKGFPRRCLNNSKIGGVDLNFHMPDVYSIALGGGSHISLNQGGSIEIGPRSCGRKTFSEALSFGGKQLTLTDVALALGYIDIPKARLKKLDLSQQACKGVIYEAIKRIYNLISKIGPEENKLPIVMIGGGSSLIPKSMLSGRFIIPSHANIANAYGAALAEISGTVDTVVSLEERQKMLESLQQQAIQAAIQQGADYKTVRIIDIEIIPYHYVPNRMARVIVRASGSQPK